MGNGVIDTMQYVVNQQILVCGLDLTVYLIETLLTLLHREQTHIATEPGYTLFAYGNMIRYDPIKVNLTSNYNVT